MYYVHFSQNQSHIAKLRMMLQVSNIGKYVESSYIHIAIATQSLAKTLYVIS